MPDKKGSALKRGFNAVLNFIFRYLPKQVSLPLILCGAGNLISYYGGMILFGTFPVRHWTIPAIDNLFPLRPLWVIIYILSFLYWLINYVLIARDHTNMVYRLVGADVICKLVCCIFFFFFPTTLVGDVQPSLEEFGARGFLLGLIYGADLPVNLFPSLHCIVAWLSCRPLLDCKKVKPWYKVFSFVFTFLIFLSTLYTKQHYFPDVIGGWILAELAYDLVIYTPLPKWLKKANLHFRETDVLPGDDSAD